MVERRMWRIATSSSSLTLLLACLLISVSVVRTDHIVMKDVTLGFGRALELCREESQLTEEKMEEFFHFWRDDFKFVDRELGCAIQCMSRYFNLLTDASRLHHQNTEEFIKSFPNGEILAQQLIDIIHECENKFDSEEDHCLRILRVAECAKLECMRRGIAPNMEIMMVEFIMESDN